MDSDPLSAALEGSALTIVPTGLLLATTILYIYFFKVYTSNRSNVKCRTYCCYCSPVTQVIFAFSAPVPLSHRIQLFTHFSCSCNTLVFTQIIKQVVENKECVCMCGGTNDCKGIRRKRMRERENDGNVIQQRQQPSNLIAFCL